MFPRFHASARPRVVLVVATLAASLLPASAAPVHAAAATCMGLTVTIDGATSGPDVINGTPGDDVIHGLGGSDIINGGGGNDTICGGGGNDHIFGDDDDDTIFGGFGNDKLYGGNGDDDLRGNAGDDRIIGDDGHDRLIGGPGDDSLSGSAGDDDLRGKAGDDRMFGNAGIDDAHGGSGSDACGAETRFNCEMTRRWGHDPEEWEDLVEDHFGPLGQDLGVQDLVDEALQVMDCESSGEPFAENPNSTASGLFQFLEGTWDRWNPQTPGWQGESVFHPEANIATAARLVRASVDEGQHRWWQWSCKPS